MNQDTKRWLDPKDYLTITLSTVALAVSAATAYFNILRTEESVSLISDTEPVPYILDDKELKIPPTSTGEITMVNSGNRSVDISNITIFYMQPPEQGRPQCPDDTGVNIETDFEATVLRPNDFLVKKIKLARPRAFYNKSIIATRTSDGGFSFPIAAHNKGKKTITIDVCLDISLSTPSIISTSVIIPVFRYYALPDGMMYDPNSGPLRKKPTMLIYRTGTILDYE